MKIKTAAAAVLTLFMLTAFSACSLWQKEKVTLVIKTPPLYVAQSADESILTDEFLKMAGEEFAKSYTQADLDIVVVQYAQTDEIEYIPDCFGTEKAADVLMAGYFNMSSYIYGGNVVPLDDLISDELKNDFVSHHYDMSKVDGKTYMLPFYAFQNTLCYNKEMFRDCGLDEYIGNGFEIQKWSTDDFEKILSVLSEKLPENSYPMMMYAKNNLGDTHIMTLLRSKGSSFFDSSGYFCLNTPEGIASLEWIKEGSNKGYFPPNCENLDLVDCNELFNNSQLAICVTNNALLSELDRDKVGLADFPSMDGEGYCTTFITGFMVFDNGNEAKLEAAKEFLKFIYSNEELLRYECKAIPSNSSVTKYIADDKTANIEEYIKNESNSVDFTANNPNWQGSDDSVRSVFWKHIHGLLSQEESPQDCAAAIDEECNAAIKKVRNESTLHE